MKKVIILFAICLLFVTCKTHIQENENNHYIQTTVQIFIPVLPGELRENSGIILYNNLLWTFNDSGGNNVLYGLNFNGKIELKLTIENAINIDWEDITQDEQFIYIGDFGNNNGVRQDLAVYRIDKKEITTDFVQSVQAEKVQFVFSNQQNFDFSPLNTAFDCEAIAHLGNELYVFTKNWKNENTVVYKLPKVEGKYVIEPIDSFQVDMLVTGADFSPDFSYLALIGYHNFKPLIWIFNEVNNQQIFGIHQHEIKMDSLDRVQTEGICFLNNNTLLISCESTFDHPAKVFEVSLNENEENGAPSNK
jgi:hypothetical protein